MHRPPFVGFDYANNIQLFASLIDVFEENSTSLAARMTHRGIVLQTLMKEDELLEKKQRANPARVIRVILPTSGVKKRFLLQYG